MQLFRRRALERPTSSGVIYGASYSQPSPVRGLRLIAVGTFLILITASASAVAYARSGNIAPTASTPTASAAVLGATTTQDPSNAAPVAAPAPSKKTSASANASCARGSYSLPSALSVTGRAAGVYIQADPAQSYRVYGSTGSALMQQMAACSPVRGSGGVFAANTGYTISNYYTYGVGSDGLCRVTSAIVTLHINQIFPSLGSTGNPAMTNTWNGFIANLRTHEQGHVNLDKSYAYQLYDAMTQAVPQSCSSLKPNVDAAAHRVISNLAAANDNYDATTNHGTTQGAVL